MITRLSSFVSLLPNSFNICSDAFQLDYICFTLGFPLDISLSLSHHSFVISHHSFIIASFHVHMALLEQVRAYHSGTKVCHYYISLSLSSNSQYRDGSAVIQSLWLSNLKSPFSHLLRHNHIFLSIMYIYTYPDPLCHPPSSLTFSTFSPFLPPLPPPFLPPPFPLSPSLGPL